MISYNSPEEIVRFYGSKNIFDFSYKELDYILLQNQRIEINYTKLWTNKGHNFGEGLISPDEKFFFLKIPKNASSFLVKNLTELDWKHSNIRDYPQAQLLVILRDPIDRWISGMVEYLFLYHESVIGHLSNSFDYEYLPLLGEQLGLSLLFERMTFDDHTERQCAFLQNVSIPKTIWFYFNENIKNNISNFLTANGYTNALDTADKVNSSEDNDQVSTLKRKLKELITYALNKDPYKKYNLEQWMWCDNELIQKVNFFSKNSE